jgi:ribosomal protein S18 acetylase RimI-like enzyme
VTGALTLVVRAALPADAAAMAALHVHAWRAAYAGVMPAEFLATLTIAERAAMWRRSLTAPDLAPAERVILVAAEGDQVLGFCAAGHARGDDELGLGELYALNVDPPAWGRGAGRALLTAATTWLDARFRVSILWVADENPRARRLYERAGWSLDGGAKAEDFGGTGVGHRRYRWAATPPR